MNWRYVHFNWRYLQFSEKCENGTPYITVSTLMYLGLIDIVQMMTNLLWGMIFSSSIVDGVTNIFIRRHSIDCGVVYHKSRYMHIFSIVYYELQAYYLLYCCTRHHNRFHQLMLIVSTVISIVPQLKEITVNHLHMTVIDPTKHPTCTLFSSLLSSST